MELNMKIQCENLRASAVAVLCLALAGAVQAQNPTQKPADKPPGTTDYRTSSTSIGTPMKFNKASSLIGMQVRNQNDEKLGEIEDVVIDLSSAKVSYAVLDAGGVLKDKLFAVPLNAFTPGADYSYLILHADKSKMEAAQGFDKASWPSVSNPTWGAEFWEKRATPGTQTESLRERQNPPDRPYQPGQPQPRPTDK